MQQALPVRRGSVWTRIRAVMRRGAHLMKRVMPKGLYARSLLIVIAPVVLLQSVIAYAFMERHWQTVTNRLSASVAADIAALVAIYERLPREGDDRRTLIQIAEQQLYLDVDLLPNEPLPRIGPKPFFDILDTTLSNELRLRIGRPFWIDTVGRSNLVEIRIQLDDAVMRVIARRSQTYASNAHIFLVWMVGTSLILLTVAILFLRNQIKPILALADAAEDFGKGREIEFRPRGAREVRRAGAAFLDMKRRIARQIEQRTTMLNGVSHDLRTVLTRFRLSLEIMEGSPELDDLKRDVDEMSRMLQAYLAFARGDAGEAAQPTDMRALLEEFRADAERQGHPTTLRIEGDPNAVLRPDAFRRLLGNLVSNAARYGDDIHITAVHDQRYLTVHVDDDGPGIPPEQREEVFRPFMRLDEARNQDHAGSGLGLAIARDIARGHGGEVTLSDSPLGGLRASVRLPA
jgi:two-component system, OmpR family, osmolarity sensor histidine kinase EnvZ